MIFLDYILEETGPVKDSVDGAKYDFKNVLHVRGEIKSNETLWISFPLA